MTWRRVDSLVAALNVFFLAAGEGEVLPVFDFGEHPIVLTNASNPAAQVPEVHPAIPAASHAAHESTDSALSTSQAVHPVLFTNV